jgi:hypothetical protein
MCTIPTVVMEEGGRGRRGRRRRRKRGKRRKQKEEEEKECFSGVLNAIPLSRIQVLVIQELIQCLLGLRRHGFGGGVSFGE